MSQIVSHGYLGVTAPNLDAWKTFATEVLGVAIGVGSDPEVLYLRVDERAWRISVEGGPGGLAFCGWEVANAESLKALAAEFDTHGIKYEEDLALAAERGVSGLIRTTDPGGTQVEFYYGAYIPQAPFVSPTGAKFVTSDRSPGDLGFGHAVVSFSNAADARQFYLDVLGFKVSDTIALSFGPGPSREALFTHVNRRHHSWAFVEVPGAPSTLNHFMLEVEDLDMVGRALDEVNARGIEIVSTLGKHTNDHMTSIYVKTPSGFAIEYGTGGRLIDDHDWITSKYGAHSYWGHQSGHAS